MQIELKKIKVYEKLSQETTAFTAQLFIDGVEIANCSNSGTGGSTFYHALTRELAPVLRKAELYCETLPAVQLEEGCSIPNSLEHVIDDLIFTHLIENDKKKYAKTLAKKMAGAVIYGTPDGNYRYIEIKPSIETILSSPKGQLWLIGLIGNSVLPKLRQGEIILNTNIPASIIESAKQLAMQVK